jgi:hypothetical protein
MFTIYEPSFDVLAFVDILPNLLADNVPARIRWAAVMRCPFAPIDIDEPETIQEVKSKFFKIGFGKATEIELWHSGHEIITRCSNTQLHNPVAGTLGTATRLRRSRPIFPNHSRFPRASVKAPEGWRSPRRFALFGSRRQMLRVLECGGPPPLFLQRTL